MFDRDWHPVAHGESGAGVFRSADGSRYAKVVGPTAVDALTAERDRMSWARQRGVPVPAVLDWAATGGGGAYLISSAVEGVPADQLPESALRAAWPSVVASVRALHGIPVRACPYRRDLDTMLALARAVVTADAVNPDFLRDEDKAIPATELLQRVEHEVVLRRQQEAVDVAVCHGDLCLPNILVDPDTPTFTGFIDLGRLGVADRHADLALLLANTAEVFPGLADEAAAGLTPGYPYRVDLDRLRFYLDLDPLTWG